MCEHTLSMHCIACFQTLLEVGSGYVKTSKLPLNEDEIYIRIDSIIFRHVTVSNRYSILYLKILSYILH